LTHTIHLVDASPYIFRGYFSIPSSMTGRDGLPVNAVYGFTQFLRRLIAEEKVTHLGLTFDESLNTSFRNEIYPPYTAQRELPPEELEQQLDWCQRMGEAMGAATYVDDRYEADDLIATLCHQLRPKGHRMVVVTSDKDLAQLVDGQTTLFDFARDERYDAAAVVAKFGVEPAQIADYLGLAGDAVDNIPGVKGVGKKTAVALLEHFGSLDAIYERLDELPALPIRGARTLGSKLADQREIAFLSRELATVSCDAPARALLRELQLGKPVPELLEPLLDELGFGRLREQMLPSS
jgi:5'-3' exonuclease